MKCIGSWLRDRSPNSTRTKKSKAKLLNGSASSNTDTPTVDSSTITDFFSHVAPTPPKIPTTTGFALFKASSDPARPTSAGLRDGRGDVGAFVSNCAAAYSSHPQREEFQRKAAEINDARRKAAVATWASKAACVVLSPSRETSLTAVQEVSNVVPHFQAIV